MDDSELFKALTLPLHRGELDFRGPAFFLRARSCSELETWRDHLVCVQGFKPEHDRLLLNGFRAVHELDGRYPFGLCLVTKHKAETLANLARGWSFLEDGGILLVAGPNSLGAAGIAREMGHVTGLDGCLSKHQCRVFWFRRQGKKVPREMSRWLEAAMPQPVGEVAMQARAGSFSAGHVDAGSRLLADHFPQEMAGRVADLGAGWGYLSWRMFTDRPEISAIDLFEAEMISLDDARANLAPWEGRASFHWHDVAAGLPKVQPYDWIVSNPPFHVGRKADPALGRAFIAAAWASIRRRGKFLLVANRTLPYEQELYRRFREVTVMAERDGFKLLLASDRRERTLP